MVCDSDWLDGEAGEVGEVGADTAEGETDADAGAGEPPSC